MPNDVAVTVRVLLDAAHLSVSGEEFDRFVSVYPGLRAQADALYLADMEAECPAVAFDPTATFG
jgi:hypothetical protein